MRRPGARLTLGLGIGRDAVRAVAVRGQRIVWAIERARIDEPLERTIGLLLAETPLPRWPRPRVVAAVGPSHAQTKRLVGLPAVKESSRLDSVIRESTSRFFLKNGVPLEATWRRSSDDAPWGAAIEQPVLEAIEQACRACRVKLEAVVPTVSILGAIGANGPGCFDWRDGDLVVNVAFDGDELVSVRRTVNAQQQGAAAGPHSPLLDALGPHGYRFSDALGAARARLGALPTWRGRQDARARPARAWRVALAAIAAVVAGTAWIASPGIAARVTERTAMARLTRLAPIRRDVAFAELEAGKLTSALNEVAAFDAPRFPMTPLLADLTHALPDGSALVQLRLARDAGSLVALTPRAAVVITSLEAIRGIEGVEIVGPVTREVVIGKALERVSVRFRVRAPERRTGHGAGGGGA